LCNLHPLTQANSSTEISICVSGTQPTSSYAAHVGYTVHRPHWGHFHAACTLRFLLPLACTLQLKVWKQSTEFPEDSDWIFASPVKIGRLPYSYTGVWLDRAGEAAGLGHMGTHTFRHSYRMWIDAIGTPVGVQQKLMRHSDIRTTMNIYGDAATEDMREAHGKIVRLALRTA